MSKPVKSAAAFSSDLLNRIIDHAHLSGRDYAMALGEIKARDRAIRLALLDEVLGTIGIIRENIRSTPHIEDVELLLDELRIKYGAGK